MSGFLSAVRPRQFQGERVKQMKSTSWGPRFADERAVGEGHSVIIQVIDDHVLDLGGKDSSTVFDCSCIPFLQRETA